MTQATRTVKFLGRGNTQPAYYSPRERSKNFRPITPDNGSVDGRSHRPIRKEDCRSNKRFPRNVQRFLGIVAPPRRLPIFEATIKELQDKVCPKIAPQVKIPPRLKEHAAGIEKNAATALKCDLPKAVSSKSAI